MAGNDDQPRHGLETDERRGRHQRCRALGRSGARLRCGHFGVIRPVAYGVTQVCTVSVTRGSSATGDVSTQFFCFVLCCVCGNLKDVNELLVITKYSSNLGF